MFAFNGLSEVETVLNKGSSGRPSKPGVDEYETNHQNTEYSPYIVDGLAYRRFLGKLHND